MFPSLQEMFDTSILKTLAEGKRDVIIFGTGQEAIWCFEYLRRTEIQVRYFCDNNPILWGTKMLERRILAPSDLPQYLETCEVMVAGESSLAVARMLEYLGNEVSLLEHPHYSPHTFKFALENEDRVRAAYDLLEDEFSKRLLIELLRLRVSLQGQKYRALCTAPKYFPPDILTLSDSEIFVDGGCHNAETILEFVTATCGQFEAIHAFEPDPRCIKHIVRRPLTRSQYKKIRINQCGLGEKDENLPMTLSENDSTGTSVFEREGKNRIQVRSLDSYLEGAPITFLKLDVEKFERQALRGSLTTLKTHKPKLAICVYHLHDDLWEIPLLVKEMVSEYKIYLRHHSHAENETVMYATVN